MEYLPGCIDRRWGGGDRYHLTPPEDILMRVPDAVQKSVLFIGIREDLPEWDWKGTAYLIAVSNAPHVFQNALQTHAGYPFMFLATARHVAENLEGKDFALRTNKKDGSIAILEGHADQRWWYHPTERAYVDAAVTIFFPPNLTDLDIFWIDINIFVTPQTIQAANLGIGDEVFLSGLFTEVTETTKNIPVVRIGNLAMMPGEKIPYKDGRLIDAYLVESRSIGGLSGSPVFVRQTVMMQGLRPAIRLNSSAHIAPRDLSAVMAGVGRIFFLGSMIGHWDAPTGFHYPETVNMGISPVVPAHKIREIIEQAELQEVMTAMTSDLLKKKHANAIEDFASSKPTQTPPSSSSQAVFTKEDFEDALRKVSRKKSDRT